MSQKIDILLIQQENTLDRPQLSVLDMIGSMQCSSDSSRFCSTCALQDLRQHFQVECNTNVLDSRTWCYVQALIVTTVMLCFMLLT